MQSVTYPQIPTKYVEKYSDSWASKKTNKSGSYIYCWKKRWNGHAVSLACQSRRPRCPTCRSKLKLIDIRRHNPSLARSVPSWVPPQTIAVQDFQSNATQCTQRIGKLFERRSHKRRASQATAQSKQKNRKNVSVVDANATELGKIGLCGSTHISTQRKELSPFTTLECQMSFLMKLIQAQFV